VKSFLDMLLECGCRRLKIFFLAILLESYLDVLCPIYTFLHYKIYQIDNEVNFSQFLLHFYSNFASCCTCSISSYFHFIEKIIFSYLLTSFWQVGIGFDRKGSGINVFDRYFTIINSTAKQLVAV
jgi:hypothetical protein